MARTVKPLTPTQCDAAKPKDYELRDGDGLILFVRVSGTKAWRHRFKRPDGKIGLMTLGHYPALSLKEARDKRRDTEKLLANSIDPIEQSKINKAKSDNVFSLEKVARAWHPTYIKIKGLKAVTAERAMQDLETHLFPDLGNKAIDAIKHKDLLAVIRKIEDKGFFEVAKKIRQRLTHIFAYAVSKEYIDSSPAINLSDSMTTHEVVHRPALSLERLPELLQRIHADTGQPLTKLCLSLTLNVFIRSSEIRFARWNEVNFERKMWTIPPTREEVDGAKYSGRGAKMETTHLVHLSPQVLQLLKQTHQFSGYTKNIFPKHGDVNLFISESTINKALRRMGYNTKVDVCGHGFRTMACSALCESGLFTEDAVERQMSHKESNKVRKSYTHKAEFLQERRKMLDWWCDYLDANLIEHITPYDFANKV